MSDKTLWFGERFRTAHEIENFFLGEVKESLKRGADFVERFICFRSEVERMAGPPERATAPLAPAGPSEAWPPTRALPKDVLEEREQCALLADQWANTFTAGDPEGEAQRAACRTIAVEIRARYIPPKPGVEP